VTETIRGEAARFAQALANASVVNGADDMYDEFSVEAQELFWDYLNRLLHNGGDLPTEGGTTLYYLPWAEVASMLLNGE
jgi:hypothetical protein